MKGKNGFLPSGKKKRKKERKRSPETSLPHLRPSPLSIISTIFSGGSSGNKPPWPTRPYQCLSLAKSLSLSHCFSFSLTNSLSFSLRTSKFPRDHLAPVIKLPHTWCDGFQTTTTSGKAASQPLRCRRQWRSTAHVRSRRSLGEMSSPAIFDCGSRSPQVSVNLLIVLVPLVRNESGRIEKQAFQDKLSKL